MKQFNCSYRYTVLFTGLPLSVSKVAEWRALGEGIGPPCPSELRSQSKWNVVNGVSDSTRAYFLSTAPGQSSSPSSSPSFVLLTVRSLATGRTDSAVPTAHAHGSFLTTPSFSAHPLDTAESPPSPAGVPGTPPSGPSGYIGAWLNHKNWVRRVDFSPQGVHLPSRATTVEGSALRDFHFLTRPHSFRLPSCTPTRPARNFPWPLGHLAFTWT